jgi:hypothetical protein
MYLNIYLGFSTLHICWKVMPQYRHINEVETRSSGKINFPTFPMAMVAIVTFTEDYVM